MKKECIILSIETSCDETAAAVLSVETDGKNFPKTKTLSAVVKSQIKIHSKMGGVVPETAARAHVKNILPVVSKALSDVKCHLSDVDYIAVTQGPGLIPSLIVGVEFAKALSLATGIPLIPINHLAGHLYSPFVEQLNVKGQMSNVFPNISLIVSGGHTMLILMTDLYHYKIIGQTVDDAAGEAFDKVAKLLKLPYPGGPEVSKQAQKGNPAAIPFPRPMLHSKDYNFSFSGLKTAVLYHQTGSGAISSYPHKNKIGSGAISSYAHPKMRPEAISEIPNICASFQQAVIDVLIDKTLRAARQYRAKSISLSGGVSANTTLRQMLNVKCQVSGVQCLTAPLSMTGDNAEMIGLAAAIQLSKGNLKTPNPKKIQANPNLPLV